MDRRYGALPQGRASPSLRDGGRPPRRDRLDRTRRAKASTRRHQTPRPAGDGASMRSSCRALAGCQHPAPRPLRPPRPAEGLDVPENARPPMARGGLNASTVPPALAGASTPAPAPPPQLAARARPQGGGRPGGDRRPPCLRSIRTPAPILEHRGGQKNWMNETRSRCQASASSPEASRAPRTRLRHLWWRLRAPGRPTAHIAVG